jgi:predicted O-methyltransferase YrrM
MSLDSVLAEVSKALPEISGWCKPEKAQALVETILSRQPELCVELGVFGGSSLIPQALALKDLGKGRVVGIDPWKTDAALEEMNDSRNIEWWGKQDLESVYRHCEGNIKKYGVAQYCHLIRDKAENVVNSFADASIGMLHIDGNHAELPAYKDATLWLPKVQSGGIVFFDDVWWTDGHDEPTTRKAIVYLLEHCAKIRLVHDCMILQKH